MNGNYVTATPANNLLANDYPKITGILEITPTEFMGESWEVYTVHAVYEDGSDAPVEVDPETVTPASERRTEKTVLEVGL